MDHATVMAGLMPGQGLFLVEQHQAGAGMGFQQLQGRSKPDDSAADHTEIQHSYLP